MKRKLKGALKSKTCWFAVIISVLSILQGFVFGIPIPIHYQALIGVLLSIVITILRFVTTRGLDDK